MEEYLNIAINYTKDNPTILYMAIGGFVLFFIILLIIIRKHKYAKCERILEYYQRELNALKSTPLSVKYNKTLKDNEDLESTNIVILKNDYKEYLGNVRAIQNLIMDTDEDVQDRKYKDFKKNISDIENLIDETNEILDKLDKDIERQMEKLSLYKEKIEELRKKYHQLKIEVNKNPDKYLKNWVLLDKIVGRLSKEFKEVPIYMDNLLMMKQEVSFIEELINRLEMIVNQNNYQPRTN